MSQADVERALDRIEERAKTVGSQLDCAFARRSFIRRWSGALAAIARRLVEAKADQ